MQVRALWTLALVVSLAGLTLTAIAAESVDLKVGDAAPTFTSTDDEGQPWKSEDHVGKHIVVVYFYPADCTGGCTKQAKGFQADLKKLKDKGVEVVGVSADSVENHKIFKKLEKLEFTLLADTDGSVAKAFGVPHTAGKGTAKTTVDGKEVILNRDGTTKRWTFVIGKDKKIVLKNDKVNAPEDSQQVLKLVEGL